jgi:hypothetical protein
MGKPIKRVRDKVYNHVIPAQPGFYQVDIAWAVSPDDENGLVYYPVVAWVVAIDVEDDADAELTMSSARPVVPELLGYDKDLIIKCPDGSFLQPEERQWEKGEEHEVLRHLEKTTKRIAA